MNRGDLNKHRKVQNIAKDTVEFLKSFIVEGISEREIAKGAEEFMKRHGAESFWYHGIGAFVFVGERTELSFSGRDYKPTLKEVKNCDLVTVDLSPEMDGARGDFARTFVIGNGKVKGIDSSALTDCPQEFSQGLRAVDELHVYFQNSTKEWLSFGDVFTKLNAKIIELGFENLDFKKNLGHLMQFSKSGDNYIEEGNSRKFKGAGLFTFEPHIRKKGAKFGFKREDIYYFEKGKFKIL